jgi:alpha-L-fucosidase
MARVTRRRFNLMMAGLPTALALRSVPVAGDAVGQASRPTTMPKGPYEPTWESVSSHRPPAWFQDAKFGLSMHWGLYAVPAHQSEWYVRHMYGTPEIVSWHQEHFGPQDKFGYKDFIPMFTCEKFDPNDWAELFKQAGARYIMPAAEHHDGFALWDSALTKFDAKDMGPKRDLIGELATAMRKQGLKFGVTNHRMEHFNLINPVAGLKTDLDDPAWAEFYSVADRSSEARQRFLRDWVARNLELIDKYQLDLLWWDNGVNSREYDPLKLEVFAYFYNRAQEWGKEVTMVTRGQASLGGHIEDYERQMRGLTTIQAAPFEVHDSPFQRWGYLSDAHYWNVDDIIWRLVENVSRNGNLLLNLAPKANGSIPEEQKQLLLETGRWLRVNGDAIYGTRPWTRFGEGKSLNNNPRYVAQDIRFTTKGDTLYAIFMAWPGAEGIITSLANGQSPPGKIGKVELLGHPGNLDFTRDAEGLKVKFPDQRPCDFAYSLKITGLKLK